MLLRELQALNLNIDLLSGEEVAEFERVMKDRYEELEKLDGQFDIELDLPEPTEVSGEEAPMSGSIIEDDKE